MIDTLAMIFTLAGAGLLARKNILGWPVSSVGNILWLVFAILTKQYPLLILNAVFIGLNCYGLAKWRADEVVKRKEIEREQRAQEMFESLVLQSAERANRNRRVMARYNSDRGPYTEEELKC